MIKNNIKLKKIYSVPDTNGASNFGGIASDGNTIFCIKANQAETIATLHEYKKDDSVVRTKFTGLNHTNGLAYYDGSVYVPLWGSKNSKKAICRISLHDHEKHTINGDFTVSNLTHYKGNYFITRTATSSDKTKQTFHVIQIDGNSYKKVKKFYVKNPVADDGYKTNQDIFYHNGYLYIMETKSSLLKSAVLVAKIGDPTASTVYSCKEVWISENTTKWEIESMCMHNGRVLFGMNTSSDGIYEKEEVEELGYTNKEITAHSTNYGSSRNATSIKNIVIHYTGNKTDTATGNGNYFKNNKNLGASANDFVDDIYVVHSVPYLRVPYSVGRNYGKNNLFGKVTNANSINIEMCSQNGKITDKTFENTVVLCRTLMKKYGIPASRVYRHYDVCSKSCPGWSGWLGSNPTLWNKFKKEISAAEHAETTQTTPSLPYVVRVTAADLNVRKEPSASSEVTTVVTKGECFTITEVTYNGSTAWGKLKSGAGYISLAYTEKI